MTNGRTPLAMGSTVDLDGATYQLRHFISLGTVLAEAEDGQLVRLEVRRLLDERQTAHSSHPSSVENSGFETLRRVPHRASARRRKNPLTPEVDALLSQIIQEIFLTQQRLQPSRVMRDVWMHCSRLSIDPPNERALRRRMARLAERQLIEKRLGRKRECEDTPRPI